MAFLKKTEHAAPFRVPSLDEASPEIGQIRTARDGLRSKKQSLNAELDRVQAQMREGDANPRMSESVAELLGDLAPDDHVSGTRKRQAELFREIADIETAEGVLTRRLAEAAVSASKVVVDVVRPEYARRVAAICAALAPLDQTHLAYQALVDELEAKGIQWSSLIPMPPTFLGSPNDPARRTARYIEEARRAGYVD